MTTLIEKTETVLKNLLARADARGKIPAFCIGNTRKVDSAGYFFSPLRETSLVVAGSIIVSENRHAREVARVIDGRVRYIFVDTEKKIQPIEGGGVVDFCNIEREVRDAVKHTKVHTYKANDMTVESVDTLLAQIASSIGGLRIAVIGAGNLGSKLALKLVERGAHVYLTRRNEANLHAIVKALNIIKPRETMAEVHGTSNNKDAATGAHILIGTSSGHAPSISEDLIEVVADHAIIMDGGKGCLSPAAIDAAEKRGLDIYRFDVQAGFEGVVAQVLRMESILKAGMGRKTIAGHPVTSVGLLARHGEIIVDNINHPTVIYGISGGHGDLIRKPTAEQIAALNALKTVVLSHGGVDSSPHHTLTTNG